jgi:hypothetical protein
MNYTKLGGYNKCAMNVRAKPYKGEWGAYNAILAEGTTSDTFNQRTEYKLSKEFSYTVEIMLIDSLGESDIFTSGIATEAVFMDRAGSRGSIAFGGHVQMDKAFEVYQGAFFHGGMAMTNFGDGGNTVYRIYVDESGYLKAEAINTYRRTK